MRSLTLLLMLFLAGCAESPMAIDPSDVRTFDAPGVRCYELIDRAGDPHFVCVRRP